MDGAEGIALVFMALSPHSSHMCSFLLFLYWMAEHHELYQFTGGWSYNMAGICVSEPSVRRKDS